MIASVVFTRSTPRAPAVPLTLASEPRRSLRRLSDGLARGAGLLAVPVQFSWPPAFRFLTASVQDPMAADINIDASVLRERSVGYLNRRRHGTAFPFAAILPPFCRPF